MIAVIRGMRDRITEGICGVRNAAGRMVYTTVRWESCICGDAGICWKSWKNKAKQERIPWESGAVSKNREGVTKATAHGNQKKEDCVRQSKGDKGLELSLKSIQNKENWKGYHLPEYDPVKIAENTAERPQWMHFWIW